MCTCVLLQCTAAAAATSMRTATATVRTAAVADEEDGRKACCACWYECIHSCSIGFTSDIYTRQENESDVFYHSDGRCCINLTYIPGTRCDINPPCEGDKREQSI